jgi:hypothetical protein
MKRYLEHHDMASKSEDAKCLLKGERITERTPAKGFCGDAKLGLYT